MARVLIVDDEKSIRLTLREFLRDAGHEVELAEEAQAAVDLLKQGGIDVVVSDIILPRVTGVELLRRIREATPGVQVILMTGEPTVETAAAAVRAGAFEYLNKPISKQAIVRAVGNAAKVKAVDDERGRLEGLNQAYRQNLEQLVEARTRSLEAAMRELRDTQKQVIQQERLKALGQMVSGIAHDFNNALMPIMGNAELLLTRTDFLEGQPEETAMLQDIQSSAKHARDIISRLREFYMPNDPQKMEALDARTLIEKAVRLTRPAWKVQAQALGKTIRVETDIEGDATLAGHAARLTEVLTNLLLNAVDAIVREGTITLRLRNEGDWAVLRVEDTGAGMSEEARLRCFEPFFSTKGQHGTGLGLSVCYGIVKRHKGRIEVESEKGRGTAFVLYLPRQVPPAPPNEALPEPPEEAPVPPAGPSGPFRILVVDDEAASRNLLVKFLSHKGHQAVAVSAGLEALRLLREGPFDAVVTDRAMPGMGGDELALHIKRLAPDTAVIMLSGFGELMNYQGEQPEGVDAIIGKPLEMEAFMDAIVRVLRVRAAR